MRRDVRRRSVACLLLLVAAGAGGCGMPPGGSTALAPTGAQVSVDRIAVFLTLALVGGVALQWPLGAISDRFSRRRVIFTATVAAAVAAVGLATVEATAGTALWVMFLLGGFSFPMYSLSGSHVNDLLGPEHAIGASSAIMLANGIGAVTGPFGASVVMTAAGPSGLWLFVAAVHGILGLYAAWRLIRRWNIPAPGKGHFVPYPARSGGLRYWNRTAS